MALPDFEYVSDPALLKQRISEMTTDLNSLLLAENYEDALILRDNRTILENRLERLNKPQ